MVKLIPVRVGMFPLGMFPLGMVDRALKFRLL